jgi:hypothetical protein
MKVMDLSRPKPARASLLRTTRARPSSTEGAETRSIGERSKTLCPDRKPKSRSRRRRTREAGARVGPQKDAGTAGDSLQALYFDNVGSCGLAESILAQVERRYRVIDRSVDHEFNGLSLALLRKRPTETSFHSIPLGSPNLLRVSTRSAEAQSLSVRSPLFWDRLPPSAAPAACRF